MLDHRGNPIFADKWASRLYSVLNFRLPKPLRWLSEKRADANHQVLQVLLGEKTGPLTCRDLWTGAQETPSALEKTAQMRRSK